MPCEKLKPLQIMSNFFWNIIAWKFWEKRQLTYLVLERKRYKLQSYSPVVALVLVFPDCTSQSSCIRTLFPTNMSVLPDASCKCFKQVTNVFVQQCYKCLCWVTMEFTVFAPVSQVRLPFKILLPSFLYLEMYNWQCKPHGKKRLYRHPRVKIFNESSISLPEM